MARWVPICKYCEKREYRKMMSTNHDHPPAKTPKEVCGNWSDRDGDCDYSPTKKHLWVWERYD